VEGRSFEVGGGEFLEGTISLNQEDGEGGSLFDLFDKFYDPI
jgi:hypothetical protein